jgi:glycosyltransferase involved in cell wall biosynthesis
MKLKLKQLFILLFYLQSSFFITCEKNVATENKHFVIVIPSYNNKKWYQKNLDSVFSQKYNNYRVIYIDDCSDDGTGDLVDQYIQTKKHNFRFTLIKNKTRKLAVANHYIASHMCDDNEIILHLDGDDWFPHDNVLSFFNEVYSDQNIWMTYGQYEFWPSGRHGLSKPVSHDIPENGLWRDIPWTPGQLRTFYAWLFKKIKLEDLIFHGDKFIKYKGKFYPTNYDVAFYFPMLEMAKLHYSFISEVVYVYNVGTPSNDFKINAALQQYVGAKIRSQEKYKPLEEPPTSGINKIQNKKIDVIIFSDKKISEKNELTQSVKDYLKGIVNIYITDKNIHPEPLLNLLKNSTSDYILFLDDTNIKNKIDLNPCIELLDKTFAYSFCLNSIATSEYELSYEELWDNVCVWNYCYADGPWKEHNTINSIYKKDQIIKQIDSLTSNPMNSFLTEWKKISIDSKKIGLCYRHLPE